MIEIILLGFEEEFHYQHAIYQQHDFNIKEEKVFDREEKFLFFYDSFLI